MPHPSPACGGGSRRQPRGGGSRRQPRGGGPDLPKDDDTLFLRLLGRPTERDEALLQSASLPPDDPLFVLVQSILDTHPALRQEPP